MTDSSAVNRGAPVSELVERAEEDPLAELLEVLPQRLSRCGGLRPRQRVLPPSSVADHDLSHCTEVAYVAFFR